MPIPRVAIVGRPNVGKSSLMNMIAGAKVSIVDPSAGTTRDRVTAIVEVEGPTRGEDTKAIEFVDTGGFGVYVAQGAKFDEIGNDLTKLTDSIEFQIQQAVGNADLVLFCVDVQQGITPQDQEVARLLREHRLGPAAGRSGSKTQQDKKALAKKNAKKSGSASTATTELNADAPAAPIVPTPIRIVATKVDGPKWELHAHELSALGFGEPIPVSAKTNYFRRDFMETVYDLLPAQGEKEKRPHADLMLAIVGKRNAGKSTLVNTLAGAPRMIVSEIAGTTRDAVDVRLELDGRSLVAIDTAGLRKKKSFQNMIDVYSLDRLQRAVDRSDIILLLLDATEKISQVDEHLAMMAQKAFKPAMIVVNKWDLTKGRKDRKGKPITTEIYEDYVRAELKGLWYAPIAFMSGKSGLNVKETIDLAFELMDQSSQRVTTGKLNRLVRAIVAQRGPTDLKGRFAKMYYVAQTGVLPPTITLVVNFPEMFRPNYLRFLENRFREELPFSEVPMRIVVRARRQREGDMADGPDGQVRIKPGRKGVGQRLSGRTIGAKPFDESAFEALGDELLSDEYTEVVDPGRFSEDADDYFDSEPTDPSPKGKKKRGSDDDE
jgi:GTP-binding protein